MEGSKWLLVLAILYVCYQTAESESPISYSGFRTPPPESLSAMDDDDTDDVNRDPCKDPMDQGTCKALIPKWYFDSSDNSCKEFNWGGCDGNRNNFDTEGDCSKCLRPTQ